MQIIQIPERGVDGDDRGVMRRKCQSLGCDIIFKGNRVGQIFRFLNHPWLEVLSSF